VIEPAADNYKLLIMESLIVLFAVLTLVCFFAAILLYFKVKKLDNENKELMKEIFGRIKKRD